MVTYADAAPIVIVSAGIGAGHDGAASELSRRLRNLGFPVLRRDFLDLLPGRLGRSLRDTYATQLRTVPSMWGLLLHALAAPPLCAGTAGLSASVAARAMLTAIGSEAAAVVSTYPLASQVLARLRRSGRLRVPVAAVMTDPSVHPLCVAEGVDVHLAPGHATALEVRRHNGVRCMAVSPIVDPAFRPVRDRAEKRAIRARLRLPCNERLAVVVAGSWGVGDVTRTVGDIAAMGAAMPVAVCGRNEVLRRQLSAAGAVVALGWVDTMPDLLRVADVVVHNAGGLSSVEAMASGVPVISYRCLPGHGAANAAVLQAEDLSPWPRSPAEFTADLQLALNGTLIRRQRAALATSTGAPDAAVLIAGLVSTAAPAHVQATIG
jgi:UDP-N-acetylglucosamine:LPS N-acetylglucosamine transferase